MKTKLFFIIFLFALIAFSSRADNPVKFKATGPKKVVIDRPFQIYFTTNAEGKDFKVPEIVDFDVLAGPFTSQSSSNSLTGDKIVPTIEKKYTYTLLAKRTGSFSVPAASITIKKQKYYSNGLQITVLPEDKENKISALSLKPNNKLKDKEQELSEGNIFIRTIVSKTKTFEQEAIYFAYRLYSRVNVVNFAQKTLSNFDGFIKNDITEKTQLGLEHYKGKNYNTIDLYQTILLPQHDGVFSIPDVSFEIDVRTKNENTKDNFDYSDKFSITKHQISAPSVEIEVSSLPQNNRPINFGAAVGDFKITSSASDTVIPQNEAVTMKIIISGTGNLRMVRTPKPRFSDSFELYDPKVTHNIKISKSGISGDKIIEYLFIPRQNGNYEIPPIALSYFDIKENEYKTIFTETHKFRVTAIENAKETYQMLDRAVEKEEVKQLGEDIRHIYSKKFNTYQLDKDIKIGTLSSLLMYLIPLIIALIVFSVLEKRKKENEDILLFKTKKANKIAKKHFKIAQMMLQENRADEFYNELLKALWTYLSYKLSIPMAELTKETISEKLQERNISEESINTLISVIDSCEFAHYTPHSYEKEKMERIFMQSMNTITKLENEINSHKKEQS